MLTQCYHNGNTRGKGENGGNRHALPRNGL
jgi:hypothetical protein